MDTSRRFTSARLRAVKGENNIREGLTPREYAQLIFDEIEDMEEPIFDLLFRGNETGVKLGINGRQTLSYQHLQMSREDVFGICTSSQPLIYDTFFYDYKHGEGPRNHLWGVLMVRRDREKRRSRELIWVKAREIERAQEITVLTPELLTELFEEHLYEELTEKKGTPYYTQTLYGPSVYEALERRMVHTATYYKWLTDQLLIKAAKMEASSRILHRPSRGY